MVAMIIKKRTYEEIKLSTQKINLEKKIRESVEFSKLIYKIKTIEHNDYFVLLNYKSNDSNDDPGLDKDDEIVEDEGDLESRLKSTFNFVKEPDSTDGLVFDHADKEKDLKLTGRLLIQKDGVIYNLVDHVNEIKENDIVKLLSVKECFHKEELLKNNFEIKKTNKAKAEEIFNHDVLETILHSDQIDISLEDIFENRDHFPITKIEYLKDEENKNTYLVELAHFKLLKYEFTTQEKSTIDAFKEIIKIYETEKNKESFLQNFDNAL